MRPGYFNYSYPDLRRFYIYSLIAHLSVEGMISSLHGCLMSEQDSERLLDGQDLKRIMVKIGYFFYLNRGFKGLRDAAEK